MPSPALRRHLAAAATVLFVLATLAVLGASEGVSDNIEYAIAVTAAIALVIALLSQRFLFSAVTAFFLIIAIYLTSSIKKTQTGMALHSYDLFFYARVQTISFLWNYYPGYVVATIALFLLAAAAGLIAWRVDDVRRIRATTVALLICTVVIAKVEPTRTGAFQLVDEGVTRYVSLFYLSWPATLGMLARGSSLSASADTTLRDFSITAACKPTHHPPNIILIHQESLFPPSIYPGLAYDHSLDDFFTSDDGRLHKMKVETYSAGSLITEFSIMTGISAQSFGDVRPFLQVFMKGRLHETLPQWLEKCGYRNIVFFPLPRSFLGLGKFYQTIGLPEIQDSVSLKQSLPTERDRFYFDNALATMQQHFRLSEKPLFIYIETMTAHSPYDNKLFPEERLDVGDPGNAAEMNEYLRRVAMDKQDGEYLLNELKRRFPEEPFLVIRFGDHQPHMTRDLLNATSKNLLGIITLKAGIGARDDVSKGFMTYYSLKGVNFELPPLPSYEILDVPFLQTIILDAAGLPLSEAQQERKRLMMVCEGLYFECKNPGEILTFHRRLINSGIVTLH